MILQLNLKDMQKNHYNEPNKEPKVEPEFRPKMCFKKKGLIPLHFRLFKENMIVIRTKNTLEIF